MREIKFRGKDIGSGRWVYGDLVHYKNGDVAILEKPFSAYGYEATQIDRRTQVSPETIGQSTGLHDKNGKEIWEGDILIDHKRKYICSWKKEETAFVIYGEDKYKNITIGHRAGSGKWVQRYFVVIGNIYENEEKDKLKEEYDCPIHGKLGGIDECPLC